MRTAAVEAVRESRPVTLPTQFRPLRASYLEGIWELVFKSIHAFWNLLRYLPRPPECSDLSDIWRRLKELGLVQDETCGRSWKAARPCSLCRREYSCKDFLTRYLLQR